MKLDDLLYFANLKLAKYGPFCTINIYLNTNNFASIASECVEYTTANYNYEHYTITINEKIIITNENYLGYEIKDKFAIFKYYTKHPLAEFVCVLDPTERIIKDIIE